MVVRELINKIGFRINEGQLKTAEARVKSFERGLQSFGQKATLFITAPFIGLNIWLAKTTSMFEQLDVSFRTMLGSTEKADKLVKDMLQFAAKTPFEIKEIGGVTKQLLATGSTAKNVIKELEILGNAAAGAGVPVWRLALNFGQVRAQGKLTGRELRDFAVAGINMRKVIGDILNVDEKQITDMVSQGKIGFDLVKQAFENMSAKGGIYHNLMKEQSKTVGGMWSNFKDILTLTVKVYQDELAPIFKGIISFGIKVVSIFRDKLSPTMQRTIFILFGLSAAVGPLLLGFAALVKIGMFVRGALLGIAAAARVANISTSLLILKFALMGIAVVGSLLLAVALFEDIFLFMKGADSLTSRLINKLLAFNEKLKSMGIFSLDVVKGLLKDISKAFDNFMEVLVGVFMGKWKFAFEGLNQMFINLFNFVGRFLTGILQPIYDIINVVTGSRITSKNISGLAANLGKNAIQSISSGAKQVANYAQSKFNINVNNTLPNNPTQEQIDSVGVNTENAVKEAMYRISNSLVTTYPEVE